MSETQSVLGGAASSYKVARMLSGVGLAAISVVLALISMPSLGHLTTKGLFATVSIALLGLMMFGSSYVEEEQHYWYWLTPCWVLLTSVASIARGDIYKARVTVVASFVILVVHRFAMRWNQTGQKHAGASDIVHTFFPRAHGLMWLLILFTFAYHGWLVVKRTFAGLLHVEVSALLASLLIGSAIIFKLNITDARGSSECGRDRNGAFWDFDKVLGGDTAARSWLDIVIPPSSNPRLSDKPNGRPHYCGIEPRV